MLIYKITNKTNGKCYIGQTKHKTIANRMKDHRSGTKTSMPIAQAIKEYGESAFEKSVLCTTTSAGLLDLLETIYIEMYDSTNPDKGYNVRIGWRHTQGTKDKISMANMGNKSCVGRNIPLVKLRKPITCSNGKTYPSTKAAAEELDLWRGNINGVLKGRLKTTGGLSFSYVTEKA